MMKDKIDEYERRIEELKRGYEQKVDDLSTEMRNKINEYESRLDDLREEHKKVIQNINREYDDKIRELTEKYEKEIEVLKEEIGRLRNSSEASNKDLLNQINSLTERNNNLSRDLDEKTQRVKQLEELVNTLERNVSSVGVF